MSHWLVANATTTMSGRILKAMGMLFGDAFRAMKFP
jgi:hypothetical protein